MTTPGFIDKNVFDSILSLLENAEERNDDELAYMKKIHNRVEQTSLVLLSDNFTGGVFTLDYKQLSFDKKGMFVSFGSTQHHSVSQVLTGHRDVLVMLFQNKE